MNSSYNCARGEYEYIQVHTREGLEIVSVLPYAEGAQVLYVYINCTRTRMYYCM